MVYLPTNLPSKSTIHVGKSKYTIPMDPIGQITILPKPECFRHFGGDALPEPPFGEIFPTGRLVAMKIYPDVCKFSLSNHINEANNRCVAVKLFVSGDVFAH